MTRSPARFEAIFEDTCTSSWELGIIKSLVCKARGDRSLGDVHEVWDFKALADRSLGDYYQVWHYTGVGKTHAYLSLLLRAGRAVANLSTTPDQQATRRLRKHLLTSVEDETGLPSITALTTDDSLTATFGTGAPLSQQQAIEAAEAWRAIYRIARDAVERIIGVQHYPFAHHPPPLETSPCGVIGFAAPRMPRAPGRPVYSPVQSSLGVAV
jgi:hypothetical protein